MKLDFFKKLWTQVKLLAPLGKTLAVVPLKDE